MNPAILKAKQDLADAMQEYVRLAATEDGDEQRTVLDWIVIYHARNFNEPSAAGGQYGVVYAPGMQYHSMLGLLQVGVDTLSESDDD